MCISSIRPRLMFPPQSVIPHLIPQALPRLPLDTRLDVVQHLGVKLFAHFNPYFLPPAALRGADAILRRPALVTLRFRLLRAPRLAPSDSSCRALYPCFLLPLVLPFVDVDSCSHFFAIAGLLACIHLLCFLLLNGIICPFHGFDHAGQLSLL